jgi:hypothetical protein
MHIAHMLVVAAHVVCCALPIGAALVGVALGAGVTLAHDFLHGHEVTIVAVSSLVVAIGAVVEWRRRRAGTRGLSPLFVASAACLLVNVAALSVHL